MSQRERILAAAVGGLVVILVLWFGYSSISSGLATRQAELERLQKQLSSKQRIVADGQRAAKKLAAYEQRALPSNIEKAQALYQTWLLDQVQKHGLRDAKVAAISRQNGRGVYQLMAFSVKGQANLIQVAKLLYDFHAVDHLHRIRRLRLKPIEGTTDIDVDMMVESLSMPGALDRGNLKGQPSNRLVHGDVDAYVKMIATRNFFAPPHLPPSLTVGNKSSYSRGETVQFSARGEDPEKTPVTYSIAKTNLEDARIDPKTGEFRWNAKENGEGYEVTIVATDGGMPAKSTTKTVKFAVKDPPPRPAPVATAPPPPKFDTAKFTFLTGVIGTDVEGESEAWLQVRTTGQMLKLRAGADFDVGSLQGKIVHIGEQEIEIETADGKRLVVYVGENLRDALPAPTDGV